MKPDMSPPDLEVLAELVRQGVPDDEALVIVRHLPTVDWNRIFWDREELALKAGVALATVSYRATRIDSERSIRPVIRKGGGTAGRAHATLWLGYHALWAINRR